MSLVGTRPPTVDEWDKYELHHRARLATKPGLAFLFSLTIEFLQLFLRLGTFQLYGSVGSAGVAMMAIGNAMGINSGMRLILISELTDLKRQMNRDTEWKLQKSSLELFIKMTV